MADITGSLTVTSGGRDYTLRLTMRSLATLQAEFGNDIGGLLDGQSGKIPSFSLLLRIVEIALGRDVEKAADIADELLTADMTIVEKIMESSFPAMMAGDSGNGKRAAKS